jgi:tetratricopeptide (TPR) repeat protein
MIKLQFDVKRDLCRQPPLQCFWENTVGFSLLRLLLFIFFSITPPCSCTESVLERAAKEADDAKDVSSLYKVANAWLQSKAKTQQDDARTLLHYLADHLQHIPSMGKLGHHYAEIGNEKQALFYFQTAGENGPHHSSLYNAGRILADASDWVGALAYLKGGSTLHLTHPKYAQEKITQVSKEAYDIISRKVATADLTTQVSADVFLYASLQDVPDQAEEMWKDAIIALVQLNTTLDQRTKSAGVDNLMEISLGAT